MPLFSRSHSTPKKGKKLPPHVSAPSTSITEEGPTTPRGRRTDRQSTLPPAYPRSPIGGIGEFGTIPSGSRTLPSRPNHPLTPPRSPSPPPPDLPPKHTFLPTFVPVSSSQNSIDSFAYSSDEATSLRQYGFLGGVGSGVILGLEDVGLVLGDVGKELQRRALSTPMLFSNQALELNQARTKLLIQTYIKTVPSEDRSRKVAYNAFLQDLKFAKENELAWLLRWALSRILRIDEATKETSRGVLEWDVYEEWRGRERAANYPSDAFPHLASLVPPLVYSQILAPLLQLLSRFAAHSHLSGLTPHALASLFSPLIFGLPTALPALSTHCTFVRHAYATEHLLLAYVRSSVVRDGVGISDLPFRLQEWVGGYPSMLASDAELARGAPRRGARVVRCERATRVVRAYSRDLIVHAEEWAQDLPPSTRWEAWESVILPKNSSRRSDGSTSSRPKFSANWRRKMCVKESLPLPPTYSGDGGELDRKMSYGKARRPGSVGKGDRDRRGRDGDDDSARWGSLAGKEWSLFEEGGFDNPQLLDVVGGNGTVDIRARLQFDLTESAKLGIAERRQTMDWTDFASPNGGFNRTDPLLTASLTFSTPFKETITSWPKEREDLRKRLVKAQKEATPFHYDTTPVVGVDCIGVEDMGMTDSKGRVYFEESFVDFWADFGMGGGWVDREELTFRGANWALIEYKSRPSRPDENALARDSLADPRTSSLYFLFEERVPLDYQHAVADPKQKKTIGSIFSPRSKKRQTGSDTLPTSRSTPLFSPSNHGGSSTDFERLLNTRGKTKKLTLSQSHNDQPHSTVWHLAAPGSSMTSPTKRSDQSGSNTITPLATPATVTGHRIRTKSSSGRVDPDDPKISEGKASFFATQRDKVIRRVKTDEETRERARREREQEVEFELRSASGGSSAGNSPQEGEDKWMDILVANGAKRMERHDALLPVARPPHNGRGLPPSPRPPLIQASPSPKPRSADGHNPYHTPETSDESTNPHIPVVPSQSIPLDPRVSNDFEAVEEPSSPISSVTPNSPTSPGKPEILSPKPQRDTIHSVVDQYQRESVFSNYTDGETDEGEGRESLLSIESDGMGLEVPKPVFDLTPGREPSPARYKHGEPLHFVGEEPEEE